MNTKHIVLGVIRSKMFLLLIGLVVGFGLCMMIIYNQGSAALRKRLREVIGPPLATQKTELQHAVENCIKAIHVKSPVLVLYAPDSLRNEIPASEKIGQGLVEFQLFGLAAATNCNYIVLDESTIMFYRTK